MAGIVQSAGWPANYLAQPHVVPRLFVHTQNTLARTDTMEAARAIQRPGKLE